MHCMCCTSCHVFTDAFRCQLGGSRSEGAFDWRPTSAPEASFAVTSKAPDALVMRRAMRQTWSFAWFIDSCGRPAALRQQQRRHTRMRTYNV